MSDTADSFDAAAALRGRYETLGDGLERFLAADASSLRRAADLLVERLRSGATIFTCGNGGSAAHASHVEAELIGRFRGEREPLRAVYLGLSTSSSTAIANDYASDEVFARPLRALASADDLLLAFSTSGTSPNVLAALDAARERGVASVLISGAEAPDAADIVLRYPGTSADAVQDGHDLILHALMDAVEVSFTAATSVGRGA